MSELSDLYQRIERCYDCELSQSRTRVVPGEGPEKVDLLFIGEAPGWHEDQQGRPFVGPAGQFLDKLLASINLRRDQVYIANVIKCRPPANRDPLPSEIKSCDKWLDEQIKLLNPKIIITLGRYSLAKFFPNESIGKIHGKPKRIDNMIYFPMYHPAAALHQGSLRKTIEDDMLTIPKLLTDSSSVEEKQPESQQLNLF
jgi:uracil-DNA glycosylase family 4